MPNRWRRKPPLPRRQYGDYWLCGSERLVSPIDGYFISRLSNQGGVIFRRNRNLIFCPGAVIPVIGNTNLDVLENANVGRFSDSKQRPATPLPETDGGAGQQTQVRAAAIIPAPFRSRWRCLPISRQTAGWATDWRAARDANVYRDMWQNRYSQQLEDAWFSKLSIPSSLPYGYGTTITA